MRGIEACRAYLERARACIADLGARNLERSKIFGRGDRIEWVVARGDHDGFMQEITEGRVLWPGLGVPGRETVPAPFGLERGTWVKRRKPPAWVPSSACNPMRAIGPRLRRDRGDRPWSGHGAGAAASMLGGAVIFVPFAIGVLGTSEAASTGS